MRLKLIQHRETCIDSVYIFEDFLDDLNYLNFIKEKIIKSTEVDKMSHSTNVKATMTNYDDLLKDQDIIILQRKILEIIAISYKLRTPHPNQDFKLSFTDCWGMKHLKEQYTNNHCHSGCHWSGAFYADVPEPVEMFFNDFFQAVELKSNMLVFFTGHIKHLVHSSKKESTRLSIGFNISQGF